MLTNKRESSNLKMEYLVWSLTPLVKLGQKGAECQLFYKKIKMGFVKEQKMKANKNDRNFLCLLSIKLKQRVVLGSIEYLLLGYNLCQSFIGTF